MNRLNVQLWTSLDRYGERVIPYLRHNEAANNLLLGLMAAQEEEAGWPVLATITNSGSLCLAAIQTDPPMNLILSFSDDLDAAAELARSLWGHNIRLPGLIGPKKLVVRFADEWTKLSGQSCRVSVQERIFAITKVEPAHFNGTLRWAVEKDLPWLIAWIEEFMREAMPEAPRNGIPQAVARRFREGFPKAGYLVVEDAGVPVSTAGFVGPTGSGIRIGPVYTPPQFRNRGYASVAVRELTTRLLKSDYRTAFLFTDLANPTSNSIYEKIGYRPVVDVDQYQFEG